MCYSAGASFVASAGLATMGVASFRVADKKHKALASIPVAFAVQQACEGFQWLSLNSGSVSFLAAYGFLFFAFLFWPVYVPITIFELDEKRKRFMRWLIGSGVAVSAILLSALILEPLSVSVKDSSICYNIYIPSWTAVSIVYILVTCGAFFFSSKPGLQWFGIILTLSMFFSALFFFYAFTSVWCFFGAVLSSMIYFYIRSESK